MVSGNYKSYYQDTELHELVEMEIRELLSKYEYDGDNASFVKGSALAAMNQTDPELGENKVPNNKL